MPIIVAHSAPSVLHFSAFQSTLRRPEVRTFHRKIRKCITYIMGDNDMRAAHVAVKNPVNFLASYLENSKSHRRIYSQIKLAILLLPLSAKINLQKPTATPKISI